MKPTPPTEASRTTPAPPFLLGATLLFWGWQTGFLVVGALLALILESARRMSSRWDVTDGDFQRVWNFCVLLFLAAGIFAFGANAGPGGYGNLFHGSALTVGTRVGLSGERTATALLRWLPMLFFPLIAAQAYSLSGSVPLTAISLILRWRQKQDRRAKRPVAPAPQLDAGYPYFIVCLFAASIRANNGDETFFWGQCALLAWALWPLRSRRFRGAIWSAVLILAIGLGYLSQGGLNRLGLWVGGINTQMLARFMRPRSDPTQRATALGQIGRLKLSSKIVVRIYPAAGAPPPTYLREASYQEFRRETWFAGRARNKFESLTHAGTNENTWILLPDKTNPEAVQIACYLTGNTKDSGNPAGLLPLPPGSGRLENLNAYLLHQNKTGAILAEGPGLVVFDAFYGPGQTIDSPPDTNWDLLISSNERPALRRVLAELNLSGQNQQRTLQAVQGFFQNNFRYSTWLGPDKMPGTNTTPVGQFLLHSRSGHCEYFATATVLLLRELGIPARYAVGYAVHENARNGYVVRDRDAHAWCLVWDPENKTWIDFDTTPASWVATESGRADFMQRVSDAWSWIGFQIAKFRWGRTEWRRFFLWALVPVLALLLYQILFRPGRRRQRRQRRAGDDAALSWPGLDSEFYQLETRLAERGIPRQASEPLSDWLERALDNPALRDLRVPLQALLRLHYRYRFDPRGIDVAERQALEREAKACLDLLARMKTGVN
ncbi:MAG TPA: transglutaminase domain-containing protein [Candidatus Acidoferrum sp.]|nr:transglutaminase domain-containing protein [Candidatus Acidoferrum sp.]